MFPAGSCREHFRGGIMKQSCNGWHLGSVLRIRYYHKFVPNHAWSPRERERPKAHTEPQDYFMRGQIAYTYISDVDICLGHGVGRPIFLHKLALPDCRRKSSYQATSVAIEKL